MNHDAWSALGSAERDELDRLLRAQKFIDAVHVLRGGGRSLKDAVDILERRRQALEAEPPTMDALEAKLAGSQPQRIEASWCRDTDGWRVALDALTTLRGRVRLHTFRGAQSDAWPQARAATELGAGLARQLDVEFRFDSPDEPG